MFLTMIPFSCSRSPSIAWTWSLSRLWNACNTKHVLTYQDTPSCGINAAWERISSCHLWGDMSRARHAFRTVELIRTWCPDISCYWKRSLQSCQQSAAQSERWGARNHLSSEDPWELCVHCVREGGVSPRTILILESGGKWNDHLDSCMVCPHVQTDQVSLTVHS